MLVKFVASFMHPGPGYAPILIALSIYMLAVQQGGSLLNRVITHLGAQHTERPYVAAHPAHSSACAVGSTLMVHSADTFT